MERLVVERLGRRIFGWAYRPGGAGDPLSVELIRHGQVVAQCKANLTLPEENRFISLSEKRRHGFEFLLTHEYLQCGTGDLQLRLAGGSLRREVPSSPARVPGNRLELHVDTVDDRGFGGWGWDPTDPDRSATVELQLHDPYRDTLLTCLTFRANRLRPDLVGAGLARGNCGFFIHWPQMLNLSDRLRTRLRLSNLEVNLGAKLYRWQLDRKDPFMIPKHIISF